jgi:hypothetical protein
VQALVAAAESFFDFGSCCFFIDEIGEIVIAILVM